MTMTFRHLLTITLPAAVLIAMSPGCDGTKAAQDDLVLESSAGRETPPRQGQPPRETPQGDGDVESPEAREVLPPAERIEYASGRAPFPEEGEQISTPITAKVLSQVDQFMEDIDPADIPDVVPWTEAGKYSGHEITVEGRIVDLGASGNINFLNYDTNWRDKFYLVIFNDLAETLDGTVEEIFLNKMIRVTGEVEEHRGRPQIKILSMDQVEFVDDEEETEEDGDGGGE